MQPIPAQARCAVHPEMPAAGTCARCGSFICARCVGPAGGAYCEKCQALGSGAIQTPPPWERRGELGLVTAFVNQLKASVLEPDKFWRSLPPEGSTGQPLLYAWLIGAIQAVPASLLQMLNFTQMKSTMVMLLKENPPWLDAISPWMFAAVLILPILVLFPLTFYLSAGLVHLGCKLWGAGDRGFNATARVLGYAQGPLLVAWIPLVGLAAVIYLIVLQVMGISRVHGSTPGKATLGILTIPILFTCCFGLGAFVFVLVMLKNAGLR